MKLLLFISLLLCHNGNESKLEKIAHARIDLMNKHDAAGLGKLFSETAKMESVGYEDVKVGPKGVEETYIRYFTTSPDLVYEITSIVTTENVIVVEYTSTGTMQHLENGSPEYMRGKKYTLKNCTRMNIENGKIVKEMTYFDQLSFLRQMDFFNQK